MTEPLNDGEINNALGDYIGKANATPTTLRKIEHQIALSILGLAEPPAWLKLRMRPGYNDQIVPGNLPTALLMAGRTRFADLDLGALESRTEYMTPDGIEWRYDPETSETFVVVPKPLDHIDITADVKAV